jgi:small nuclear ribonucleoprotein (snRNP)-like protein
MSTRQLRLNDPVKISKQLKELKNKKINIVLHDGTTVLATIVDTNESAVEVLNMRLKKVKLPLSDISEIYYDTKE